MFLIVEGVRAGPKSGDRGRAIAGKPARFQLAVEQGFRLNIVRFDHYVFLVAGTVVLL